ncbi:aspartate carbamoyltransferase [Geoglobus ahangari]|uniref:Aspartate carbamoyltransferase n=1 Tax=Geoglobus ahangari TaxID=113653 RepID=A0A0F7IIJ9_9EURY|nr:aspartate carbamoyltransferase [Geoglobus ahangari]AKG91819.1 aspartate carbamoyltransferase [Geoglobus ahangari]
MSRIRHLISIDDLSKSDIEYLLDRADDFLDVARGKRRLRTLEGKILANLFFEPSTRTRMSFESAMKRLGGEVINLGTLEATSVAKGESLADTLRVVEQYADCIVLRHYREGSARFASQICDVPVINAGDGAGQHPTQTLLDLYTIRKEARLNNLKIALIGDLKYSRTVHSLIKALALFNAEIYLVSPETLRLPEEIMDVDVTFVECDLKEAIENADVLYVTRIQRERFPDEEEYRKVAGSYRLTAEMLENSDAIVMHPLPRVDEISYDVDGLKNAVYFRQAFYGVPVRMAILSEVMS